MMMAMTTTKMKMTTTRLKTIEEGAHWWLKAECKAVDSSDSEESKSKPKSVETDKNDLKDEVKEEEETEKVSPCLVCKETFGDKKSLVVHMTECLGSKDDLLKGLATSKSIVLLAI